MSNAEVGAASNSPEQRWTEEMSSPQTLPDSQTDIFGLLGDPMRGVYMRTADEISDGSHSPFFD